MKTAPFGFALGFRGWRARPCGFALVITLVVISLLTLIVTAFLTSSTADRLAARAYLSRAQADAAARGAADEAMATLKWAFESFPDAATTWNPKLLVVSSAGTSVATGGTEFWFHATGQTKPDLPAAANNFQRPPTYDFANRSRSDRLNPNTFVIPLVSGLATQNDGSLANGFSPPSYPAEPDAPAESPVVDLNVRISAQDRYGWIGSPSLGESGALLTVAAPQPVIVPWVEKKDAAGLVIARYAWWAEDESFRVNANLAGVQTSRADNSADPALPLGGGDVSLITALRGALGSNSAGPPDEELLNSIYQVRQGFPAGRFPEGESYLLGAPPGTTLDRLGALRFLLTTRSTSLNLSRHGSLRFNLDRLGATSEPLVAVTLPSDTGSIQKQVDRLVSGLVYHLPDFGQRFFRDPAPDAPTANRIDPGLSTTTANPFSGMARIYFYKTAASIRDYLDQDAVPTVLTLPGSASSLDSPLQVRPASAPVEHPGENDPQGVNPFPFAVIGKEAGPFILKAAAKYRAVFSGFNFTLETNYYAVLWNPGDREIDVEKAMGPNAFVLFRLPTDTSLWVDQKDRTVVPPSGQSPQDRHLKIFLRRAFLPAKSLTVVTTDASTPISGVNVIRPPAASVEGTLAYNGAISQSASGGKFFIKMLPGPAGSSGNYEHNVVLGSDWGFIDGVMGCPSLSSLPNLEKDASPEANTFARGGRMLGNDPPSGFTATSPAQTGDPRSNNEQLNARLYLPGSNPEATRFIGDSTLVTASYDESKLVRFLTTFSDLVNPGTQASGKKPWADFYEDLRTAVPAGAFVAANEGGIRSAGELGHVYDASRSFSSLPGNEKYTLARGGGRSFRVGQPDDLIDPRPLSASREGWASWRLTDILSTRLETQREGLVNVNGILRDHGVALRAALAGMTMQPSGPAAHGTPPSQIGGRSLGSEHAANSPGIEAFARFLADRLKRRFPSGDLGSLDRNSVTWGPLFERGEASECPLFNQSSSPLFQSADLSRTYDRGREEIFRRMAEMITTKGNTFSVYCVGQSIFQSGIGGMRQILSSQRTKITFRLKPVFLDASTNPPGVYPPGETSFTAFDHASVSKRFACPSRYDIEILEVSPGP